MTRAKSAATGATGATVDADEIRRFSAIAAQWWDPNGEFRPLHKLNPTRLEYVRDRLARHFGRSRSDLKSLKNLKVLDVGCGGGLISEPLARMGAEVTGIDASQETVHVARTHAGQSGLAIDYRVTSVEALAETGETFDALVMLEIIEHVADVPGFLAACRNLVKDDGVLVFSTLNRTAKSFATAIVGAEYVLRWLPRGTHDWRKFLTPQEFSRALETAGFSVSDVTGIQYNPLADRFSLGRDTKVNYLGTAVPA